LSSTLFSKSPSLLTDFGSITDQLDLDTFSGRFLRSFVDKAPSHLIDNVDTKMLILNVDDLHLPITINEREFENSYVCSPFGHFVSYAYDQIQFVKNRKVRSGIHSMIKLMEMLLRSADLNRVIIVNNFLFSTVLYPTLTSDQIQTITSFLSEKYPDYAILFRSVNPNHPDHLEDSLRNCRYDLIPCREVYLTDPLDPKVFKSRMLKSDLKILKKSEYNVLSNNQISPEHAPRLKQLYRLLNVDKYSKVNPQFNENFFIIALEQNLLDFKALEKNGRIDAILGYYNLNGVMTSPLFGYDTQLPQELGLYRQISTLLSLEAYEKKLLLNGSGGAGSYKKLRRAKPVMESMAVYSKHLHLRRQVPWKALRTMMVRIGVKLMKYFEG